MLDIEINGKSYLNTGSDVAKDSIENSTKKPMYTDKPYILMLSFVLPLLSRAELARRDITINAVSTNANATTPNTLKRFINEKIISPFVSAIVVAFALSLARYILLFE